MSSPATTSPLDTAYAYWLHGDEDSAIRRAASLLAKDPSQLGAATLRTHLRTGGTERHTTAADICARQIARGDLPAAVVAARLASATRAPLLIREIAVAFGKGSSRVRETAGIAPPAFPGKENDDLPELADLSGDPLHTRCRELLLQWASSLQKIATNTSLPMLPLFSRLPPPELGSLLLSAEVVELDLGDVVIQQGASGEHAFVVVRGTLSAHRESNGDIVPLATLGPGSLFGEMALVSGASRVATVLAEEPTTVLRFGRVQLERIAAREPAVGSELASFCHARMLTNLMRTSRLLTRLPDDVRQALHENFAVKHYDAGEQIVSEGHDTDRLSLVASGSVEVIGTDATGSKVRLGELSVGEVFGEISLVLRRAATASVIAIEPTVTLELDQESFQQLLREHPELLSELYEIAVSRAETTRNILHDATESAEWVLL